MCRPARLPSDVVARRRLLALGGSALVWLVLGAGHVGADPPDATLAELEQRTREYQDALGRLAALEEQALARAAATAERYRALEAQGLLARREVDHAEQAAAAAQARLAETRSLLADAEGALVEAQALRRLAALPPMVSPGVERSTPEVSEYRGTSPWSPGQLAGLERFFAARFGRPLPVSALGQTATHDRLGFDHRNAVDVAVHPDSVEGRALLDHLRAHGIPFLAFRGPLAGSATGAHIHVGAASPRS